MTMGVAQERLPWDRMTGLAIWIAAIATFALYGAAMTAFFERTIDFVQYPFGNDYGEGPILFQVTALAAGKSIYLPIAEVPYAVSNYPPVFHFATLLLTQLIADPLTAGRVVSFLGTLASGCLIYSLVQGALHRDHIPLARRTGGALAALFFLTHYTVIGWSTTMRVDTLALAFGLLGMQIFVLAIRRPALAWVYGLVFVLAVFTKPNLIAAAVAAFATGYFLNRRSTMTALAVAAAVGLAGLGLISVATDGEFLRHVVTYNINEYRFDLLFSRLRQSLFWRGVDFVLLFGLVGYATARLISRRRTRQDGVGSGTPDVPLLLFGGFMAASLVNVAGSGKTGASVSYFLEFEAAASLLLGTLAVRLASYLRSHEWSPVALRHRLMVVVALAILGWQAMVGWNVKFREPDWPAVAYSRQVAEIISTATGPVVSEEMVLLHRANQPLYFQPFIMTRLARDGRWNPGPLIAATRRGEVAYVVLYSAIGSARYQRRFPEGFRVALESRYRLHAQIGHLGVFVPR